MAAEEKRVYMLTSKGNAELTGAKTSLSAADLKLLVMVDGEATVEQIAKLTQSQLPAEKVAMMLRDLAKAGFIADPDGTAAINVGDFFKEADFGLSSLQQKGFFVRIARRPEPKKPEPGAKPAEKKPTVLVVEDDPQLAKMLRTYLTMEDFAVRVAATRDEINKALREQPRPDVVLLDVVLPDLDGFDVLAKMRQHEAMKNVPIIMATAKATREAVLEGLRRGADGYVTKPYDVPVLLNAVKTVLGIA
ncbi:MAG: response regulator transcription factor [Burkholderiales bacterium]